MFAEELLKMPIELYADRCVGLEKMSKYITEGKLKHESKVKSIKCTVVYDEQCVVYGVWCTDMSAKDDCLFIDSFPFYQ